MSTRSIDWSKTERYAHADELIARRKNMKKGSAGLLERLVEHHPVKPVEELKERQA